MKSLTQALTWEFLRHNVWLMIFLIVIANALPMLILFALSGYQVDFNSKELRGIQGAIVPLCAFLIGLAVTIGQGPINRLYLKPVATSTLVRHHFISGALWVAAGILASLALWNFLFGLRWPIMGPTLFGVAFWAVLWPSTRVHVISPTRIVEVFCIVILMALLCMSQITDNSQRFGLWGYVGVITASFAGYLVSVQRASYDRCGKTESWVVQSAVRLLRALDLRMPMSNRPLKTPMRASFWYEFSIKGLPYVAGIAVLLTMIVIVVLTLLLVRPTQELNIQSWPSMLLMLFASQVFFAGLSGFVLPLIHMDNTAKSNEVEFSELTRSRGTLGTYQSCMPITNAELSKSILSSIAVSLLGVFAMFGILALGCFIVLQLQNVRPETQGIPEPLWAIAGCAVGSWVAMANASMLVYSGRWKALILPCVFSTMALPFFVPLFPISLILGLALIACCVIASVCWWSYRSGAIRSATLALCGAIAIGGAFIIWQTCPILTREAQAVAMTLPALAILPIAGMPLAIASSRAQ